MKKGILLVIGLSINMLSFAAHNDLLNQLLILGTILDQVRQQGVRNNLIVSQPTHVQHISAHKTHEQYKTLKRNQPQRFNKNRHHHNH